MKRYKYNQRTLTIGGKYKCMAELLFDWFGFNQTSKLLFIQHKQSS